MLKFILLSYAVLLLSFTNEFNQGSKNCKAWIEIEGEINNLSVYAKFQNRSDKILPVSYILKVVKNGRTGRSTSLQRGQLISPINKILALSESRMNLLRTENLYISLAVYHNKELIAQDSVVFNGDNE